MLQTVYPCFVLLLSTFSQLAFAQESKPIDTAKKERSLKEVTVVAHQDPIETAPGKTIVNVQAMAGNAGKTMLELLRKLPGVSVDGQGNVSMAGKPGVLVTVDGRETYLSGDDLRDYLQGMTAEEVAQVELITQPSAAHDAEGNAGIINIKTRKGRRQGLNGNLNANGFKSKYGGATGSLLLNYRKNKVNLYTSINYINASNTVDWRNDFQFRDTAGNTVAKSSMHSVPVEIFEKWNVRIGADYNYSANTTVGVGLVGAYYGNTMHTVINTTNDDFTGSPVISVRNTSESSLRRNPGCNMYLKHSFSKRSELNVNLDYLLFNRIMSQYLTTDATKGGAVLPDQLVLRSRLPRNNQVWSAKADHILTFPGGTKIESGAKLSSVTIDNAGIFSSFTNGKWAYDSSRSDHFLFDEHIGALYVNAVKKINAKWSAQLGIRGEIATIHGLQKTTGQEFSRELPAVFPTAYLNYKPDSGNSLELNYGRRVERPQYSMLNPFNYYTFYNTYQRGNPALLPQYSHNVELKHVYKNKWTTALGLSSISDILTYVTISDNQTQTTVDFPENFGTTKLATLSVTYNGRPLPWWDIMVTTMGRYGAYSGLFNNIPVSNEGGGVSIWANNQLTFGKWITECWMNGSSDMVASPVAKDLRSINMGFAASRKLLHDSLDVKIALDDPFYIYTMSFQVSQPGLYSVSTLHPNNVRSASISVTYNFGRNTGHNREERNIRPEEAGRM